MEVLVNIEFKPSDLLQINKNMDVVYVEYLDGKNKRREIKINSNAGFKIKTMNKLLRAYYYCHIKAGNQIDITDLVMAYIRGGKTKYLYLLDHQFQNFIRIYTEFVCSRCVNKGHHNGDLHSFFSPIQKFSQPMLSNFFADVEHGFFHGIMASFICYLMNLDGSLVEDVKTDEELLPIFVSATMHDFLKTNGVPQSEHDVLLKEWYNQLLPETYVHSNPPEHYQSKHLILADRLELRRYPDYLEWVDERFYELYHGVKTETKELLNLFYTNYRPCLTYFYQFKKDVFIRHGTETNRIGLSSLYPPVNSSYVTLKNQAYPIEIDTIPLNKCSNHDETKLWNSIKGFISFGQFIYNKGEIVNSKMRDHLYARSNIKMEEWVFVFQNINKSRYYHKLEEHLSNYSSLISQEAIWHFFDFEKKLTSKLVVLQKL